MFSPKVPASPTLSTGHSRSTTQCQVGFPIRRSRDQRVLSPPPGLSQSATSFIASYRLGIHQTPFSRLIRPRRRRTGLPPAVRPPSPQQREPAPSLGTTPDPRFGQCVRLGKTCGRGRLTPSTNLVFSLFTMSKTRAGDAAQKVQTNMVMRWSRAVDTAPALGPKRPAPALGRRLGHQILRSIHRIDLARQARRI